MGRWTTLLICVGAWLAGPSLSLAGENYALLVGVADYDEKELRPLRFSRADVVDLHAALLESGFPAKNVILMHDDVAKLATHYERLGPGFKTKDYIPTGANIRKEIELMLGRLRPDDSVIVALAGHGVQFQGDEKSYFCPSDAALGRKSSLIAFEEIFAALKASPASRKLFLVDACQNDPQSEISRSRATVNIESVTRPQTEAVPEGIIALFSCKAGQKAFEHPPLGHGVFFYHLLDGWKGKADTDKNGQLSFQELASYTEKKTAEYAAHKLKVLQTPVLRNEFSGGEWVLRTIPKEQTPTPAKVATSPPKGPAQTQPIREATVSFTRDIAPFLVQACLDCHSGAQPKGNLSLETFEKLLAGGKSGAVLKPGDLKGSRLWKLVGEQNPIKMPPGRLTINARNHSDLKKWIQEGARFDGDDPKSPLQTLVSSDQQTAQELAKLSHDELTKRHLERDDNLWQAALDNEQPERLETKEFILTGNVGERRLAQVQKFADENAKQLRATFGEKVPHLWKGKLSIFIMKDRLSLEKFNTINSRRTLPKDVTGYSVASLSGDGIYICLQDVGDMETQESGGLELNLMEHMAAAILQRSPGRIPDWALRGTGLAIATRASKNDYVLALRKAVPDLLKTISNPEDVFADGKLSPESIVPIGYTLVEFLLKKGGGSKFSSFIRVVQGGTTINEALRSVYGSDARNLALLYGSSIGAKRK